MPLVAHNQLPSFERMRSEGYRILSPERAREQDIRGLHIGLLNMMPDAALEATERQFFRLVGSSNPISQFYMHPFTLDEIPRNSKARQHISTYYDSFSNLREAGLDALIISGANVSQPDLREEIFWEPLQAVIEWADQHVTSTLCSCLATHAVVLARHGIVRTQLENKCWGVFEHEVVKRDHPLVQDVNTRVSVPHSRFTV
jgi:homoserine O-succinyltransferase